MFEKMCVGFCVCLFCVCGCFCLFVCLFLFSGGGVARIRVYQCVGGVSFLCALSGCVVVLC